MLIKEACTTASSVASWSAVSRKLPWRGRAPPPARCHAFNKAASDTSAWVATAETAAEMDGWSRKATSSRGRASAAVFRTCGGAKAAEIPTSVCAKPRISAVHILSVLSFYGRDSMESFRCGRHCGVRLVSTSQACSRPVTGRAQTRGLGRVTHALTPSNQGACVGRA